MREYEASLQSLNVPAEVVDVALGHISLPLVGWSAPSRWYGFPPALIPIASSGSGPDYLGLWKHWFTDRASSYVSMYVGSGRLVVEIARTADQFFCYIAMKALGIDEGIEPPLKLFAQHVGIPNLAALDAVSLDTGDDPQGMSSLPQFQADLPLSSVRKADTYTGDFPVGDFADPRQRWKRACSFELPREFISAWPDWVAQPRWLSSENKQRVFTDLMAAGDLAGAWLTLNSTGWTIDAAKSALNDLVRIADNSKFATLAEAWLKVADSKAGGY